MRRIILNTPVGSNRGLSSLKRLLAAMVMLTFLLSAVHANAQIIPQGAKFIGTGGVAAQQGSSVALSADGNIAIVGGPGDNSNLGAIWVFTRTAGVWSQQGTKLIGSGSIGSPYQGFSVALSADGTTALVGGPGDNGGRGAVWVFTRISGIWLQQGAKLVGTGGVGTPSQGVSVALSADGNTALVGGSSDNGDAGAMWVFIRTGSTWSQQGTKLVGTGAVGAAEQGRAVAISGDGNTAFTGGPSDNNFLGAGWVFTRSGSVWTQQGGKLIGGEGLGFSAALSTDGNTGVFGAASDFGGIGAAYVFTRSGGVWTQQGPKLVGSGYVDYPEQGISIGLSANGNTVLMGGWADSNYFGAAWVFTREGGVWTQQGAKLIGAGASGTPNQGRAVALSADGTTILVGGPSDAFSVGATWAFIRPAPVIVSAKDVPNDEGGMMTLRWNASLLDRVPNNTIDSYWIWRQVPNHRVSSPEPEAAAINGSRPIRKSVEGGQTFYWEYVGSQIAHGYPGYSYPVATLSDSVSGSNPYTVFMVEAERLSTGEYWSSAADSGYSVDNLPPGPPTPVAAAYSSGATHLHWGASPNLDFSAYRIYRGASAGFTPGPANLLAMQPDTGYADVGPAGNYYKLSAMDTHGNESGFALITPSGTLGAPGSPSPREVSLAPIAPNPMRGNGMFHFALPREASASLAIYDAGGRLVRELARGLQMAGDHDVKWDGRDAGGHSLADGIYFLRLEVGPSLLVARFVQMR